MRYCSPIVSDLGVALSKTSKKSADFLSLKWKVAFLFTAVLVSINSLLALRGYQQLHWQFNFYQEQVRQQQYIELKGLIESGFREMQQLAVAVPLLDQSDNTQTDYLPGLQTTLNNQMHLLSLEWGIEEAQVFDLNNAAINAETDRHFSAEIIDWVKQVNAQEVPLSLFYCSSFCRQYVVTPLLHEGRHVGALLIGRSIADLVLTFKQVTNSELILFLENDPLKNSMYVTPWHGRVLALSSPFISMPLIKSFAGVSQLDQINFSFPQQTLDQRHYEIHELALTNDFNTASLRFLVIRDLTEPLQEINIATGRNLLAGIVGLLLSVGLLLALLWRPLQHINSMASILPRLADSKFSQVRKALEKINQNPRRVDEIHILANSAHTLSQQLEALQKQVKKYTGELERQRDKLRKERDFSHNLMDTAQVLIFTHDAQGQILSANRFSESETGYSEKTLTTKNFLELLQEKQQADSTRELFIRLVEEDNDHLKSDSWINSANGNSRVISWFHSCLPANINEPNILLTVGLDVTDRMLAEKKLAWAADHDPLTETLNRRGFQNQITGVLSYAKRYHQQGALLIIDLDNFKMINDTSGHQAGDLMLKKVARQIQRHIRETDRLARLGGDEFALILPASDKQGSIQLAEKIREQINQLTWRVGEMLHNSDCSIGIALFPEHGDNAHDLMANADLAMYKAKKDGRIKWSVFSADDKELKSMTSAFEWKQRIDQALRENRFVLYYQPILDLQTNLISHYEVLIRMLDEQGEPLSPGLFIPAAEASGQIHEIDRLVLNMAIQKLANLQDQHKQVTLAVNLSGRVVDDPQLPKLLKQQLKDFDIDPSRLIFELTETAAVSDVSAASELVNEIRALGCKFALDDFGVGFSSFFYLKQLAVDFVKLDGAFIRDLTTNTDDQVFTKALVQVAQGMGKKTVAEFVENGESLQLLKQFGVDYAQGYYIGRPASNFLDNTHWSHTDS